MKDREQITEVEWMWAAAAAQPKPVWCGNLADDCTARWAGLTLRAECMDDNAWWWAVYLDAQDLEIASSSEFDAVITTGDKARTAAEQAALAFIQSRGNT